MVKSINVLTLLSVLVFTSACETPLLESLIPENVEPHPDKILDGHNWRIEEWNASPAPVYMGEWIPNLKFETYVSLFPEASFNKTETKGDVRKEQYLTDITTIMSYTFSGSDCFFDHTVSGTNIVWTFEKQRTEIAFSQGSFVHTEGNSEHHLEISSTVFNYYIIKHKSYSSEKETVLYYTLLKDGKYVLETDHRISVTKEPLRTFTRTRYSFERKGQQLILENEEERIEGHFSPDFTILLIAGDSDQDSGVPISSSMYYCDYSFSAVKPSRMGSLSGSPGNNLLNTEWNSIREVIIDESNLEYNISIHGIPISDREKVNELKTLYPDMLYTSYDSTFTVIGKSGEISANLTLKFNKSSASSGGSIQGSLENKMIEYTAENLLFPEGEYRRLDEDGDYVLKVSGDAICEYCESDGEEFPPRQILSLSNGKTILLRYNVLTTNLVDETRNFNKKYSIQKVGDYHILQSKEEEYWYYPMYSINFEDDKYIIDYDNYCMRRIYPFSRSYCYFTRR